MPNPFPNAVYPTAYAEADFLKSGDATVNEGGVGVDEIQSVFNDATGGTFTLTFDAQETSAIPYDVGNDAAVKAAVVLTISAIPVDNDTVTINGRVYKFETTLGATDDVAIGGSEAQAKLNIISVMDLSGVQDTDYDATVANADIDAAAFAGDVATFTAKVAGLAGNAITSTASLAGGDFAAGTLLGGLESLLTALELLSTIVDVTVTGLGTSASPWLITFVDPGDEDVAALVADDTSLTGQTLGTVIANVTAGREPVTISDVAAGQGPL